MTPDVYVLIPTFREPDHLRRLLDDLAAQTLRDHLAVVVNSDPGDATSALLAARAQHGRVVELAADPATYWAGAIAMGQRWVQARARPDDLVVLLNADVRLPAGFLARARAVLAPLGRAMITAVTVDGERFVSSGCRMLSWPLALTRHVLVGPRRAVPPAPVAVDMLAGRALCFPARALAEVGLVAADALPHYGADYEYTARARRRGYALYVAPGLEVANDSGHTGLKGSRAGTTLAMRLRGLADIRSTANLAYRTRFVLLTYPWYALPSGLVLNWLKALLEVGLGEVVHRRFTLRGTAREGARGPLHRP